MDSILKFTSLIRCFSLIFIIHSAYPVYGQQIVPDQVIDLISPSLKDSLNNKGLILVKAEIVSHTALKTFKIFNNEVVAGSEESIKVVKKDSNTYIMESLIPLVRGQNIIYVYAKNSFGSVNSEKRKIISQPEPFIRWLLPGSVNSVTESGTVTIKAELKTEYDLKNAGINVNGTELTLNKEDIGPQSDDTYILERSVQVRPGKNSISVTASNIRGITNSTIRYISFSLPIITLVSPSSQDSLNNKGITLIRAEIVSRTALKSIRIFDNEVVVGNEAGIKPAVKDSITCIIEGFIPLVKGQNIIYIEAKNSIGTASSEKRVVSNQPEPFVTWILPSSVNSASESGMVKVKAEIRTDYELKNINLNLNGAELAVEKAGITRLDNNIYELEASLSLKKGKNSIYVTAGNIRGVTNSEIRYIDYSSGSVPVITIVAPNSVDSLNNKGIILVSAEIISQTELKTFRIFDNEVIVASEVSIKAAKKDSINYIIESLVPLNRGRNIIYVEAINTKGSASSEKRIISSQLEPFVTWLLPASINSSSGSGTVKVKAEIKTDFDLKNASIYLNGHQLAGENGEITPVNDNTYLFERTIRLNSERNSIYISASNVRGFTSSAIRIINFINGAGPVIKIISPSAVDSLNNSGIVLVSAEIVSNSELQTVRIFRNKMVEVAKKLEQKDSITYVLKSLVPLQAGANVIFVDAKNLTGTVSSEKRIVVCQLEPIIKWILPATTNLTVGSGILNIRAEIKTSLDLLNAGINLNGVELASEREAFTRLNNDTYSFEKTIELQAGPNSLVLSAVNAKGTGHSNKRYISYVPGIITEIKWVSPVENNTSTYKAEVQVSATIRTTSEIKDTHLSLNGTGVPSYGIAKISKKNSQEYLYENTLILKPGVNTIELSATSDAGTMTSEKHIITYVVAALPALFWKNPVTDQPVVDNPSLNLSMNIKSSAKLESIVVYHNGRALEQDSLLNSLKKENEDFVLEGTVSLVPGDNSIYVVAANLAGKTTSEIRNIKYLVSSRPVITWGNPEADVSLMTTETIILQADISSPSDLYNLQLFHNEKVLSVVPEEDTLKKRQGEYRIEKTLTLDRGENRIYITAENSEGRSTSEVRSINYLVPEAPAITWLNPSRPHTDVDLFSTEIKASIKSFDRVQSVLVYVNGVGSEELKLISPEGRQGEYTLLKTINLQPGENNIYLAVTNSVGTTKSETCYLTNSPANPPEITWTVPVNDSAIVNSDIVAIEACVKSATGLMSIQILVNGIQQASEMTFQTPQTGECSYNLSKSVVLKEGDNSVFIIAENSAGSNRSDKRLIRFQTTLTERRLALIIGNSDYGPSMVLKNPVNDANLMEGTLKTLGFIVVKLLNATKNDMLMALRDFSRKLPEYNVALFYYAGHGIQVEGQNYLIPTDAVLKEPADCKWETVSQNTVVEEFERVPDNINIVILDACRNNPFVTWSRGASQGFRVLNAVTGTIISYATSENSTAADGPGFNGTFTEELVKQMNIPQSISSVFMNTRKQVMKRTNNLQRPAESNMLTGEFYFKK